MGESKGVTKKKFNCSKLDSKLNLMDELNLTIAEDNKSAVIYIDCNGRDYNGLKLVSESFADDVKLVSLSEKRPWVVNDIEDLKQIKKEEFCGTVIVAGSIENNKIIDSLIAENRIDISEIKEKRECYKIQVIENTIFQEDSLIKNFIIIAGSDKRGAIYGLYHISEMIGVSPWVYFADVKPVKRKDIVLKIDELNITSNEPSVKYRGFFLNDEWPSLGSWVMNTFGDFNELFYDKVFQLILRLKGNFMWPAMWSAIFSENGKSNPLANAELADAYGIVMGTSHHESMFRAGEEWKKINSTYGGNGAWDFRYNKDAITKFWEDGLKRNKDFESIITVGMRGEQDSALEGTEKENIELLKKIILTQKELLKKQGLENAPQVLTIYKEVEKYWYGSENAEGLRYWDVLDDVTIMLADDNFANVRTLPAKRERNRKAGWGMYYHFDYHGGPFSYEWVNTTPLEKVWEQMSMAYDYGVRDIWIVNVGDLKPMELPLSYFMDLAYDFEKYGKNGLNKTREYTKSWAGQQFRNEIEESNDILNEIESILTGYTKMSGFRRPEVTFPATYSYAHYDEAEKVLNMAIDIETKAEKYYEIIPDQCKDSYYQLVYYPAAATANIVKMQIYAGYNNLYYKEKSALANVYASLVEECKKKDIEMQKYYNEAMSNGKWKGMMSSPHIGYTTWNPDGWTYPEINNIELEYKSLMIVDVQGRDRLEILDESEISLPNFTNINDEIYSIIISNGGNKPFNYEITTSHKWIMIGNKTGTIKKGKEIKVSIKWDMVKESKAGFITISGAGKSIKIYVKAEVIDIKDIPSMTFIESHNVISIEAEHFVKNISKTKVQWKVLKNYGRTLSGIKMFPTTESFDNIDDSPYLEYSIKLNEDAEYDLSVYTSPANNIQIDKRLKYAVQFDDENPVIVNSLSEDFIAGDYNNESWCRGVLDNIRISKTNHKLNKGIHTLRFYGLDGGIVLEKLVLSNGKLPYSYFGPEESYFTKS